MTSPHSHAVALGVEAPSYEGCGSGTSVCPRNEEASGDLLPQSLPGCVGALCSHNANYDDSEDFAYSCKMSM